MLVALCPLKPTNPKPRGPPRRAALWLRKNPQLRSSFIADDNEQYRPKIAGGDFLPGVHIRVGGFADVSQSNGKGKSQSIPKGDLGVVKLKAYGEELDFDKVMKAVTECVC